MSQQSVYRAELSPGVCHQGRVVPSGALGSRERAVSLYVLTRLKRLASAA